MVATSGSAHVSCVGGGATTMLIIGLLVGGLILICSIAFAYAKFNDKRGPPDGANPDGNSKGGRQIRGANARKAMDEETIKHNQSMKIKQQQQNYETHTPTNIYSNVRVLFTL